jgi:hypothetical protein
MAVAKSRVARRSLPCAWIERRLMDGGNTTTVNEFLDTHIFRTAHDLLNFQALEMRTFKLQSWHVWAQPWPSTGPVFDCASNEAAAKNAMTAVKRSVGCVAPERETIQVCW